MEKLQKAVQKAREQRVGANAVQTPRIVPSSEDAWEALTPVDLETRQLERNRIFPTVGRFSTPFDILRTKVLLMMRKNSWTRLAITSPTADCGKTTTACNLAIGFSRQRDVRSILVEFDLRKPSIARTLALPERPEISDMLHGEVAFADQALRYGDNVAISAARRPVNDPTSVLLNRATHETLAQIEADYTPDIVIFDLPPLLVSDDARAFLKDVDCALIIARAESSTVAQIDFCEREIAEQTNTLGVALNQCKHIDDMYGGYQGYSYSDGS